MTRKKWNRLRRRYRHLFYGTGAPPYERMYPCEWQALVKMSNAQCVAMLTVYKLTGSLEGIEGSQDLWDRANVGMIVGGDNTQYTDEPPW